MQDARNKTIRLRPYLVRAVVEGLQQIFNEGAYADKAINQLLKTDRRWGAQDRAYIASTSYDIVRWFSTYKFLLGKDVNFDWDWWHIVAIHHWWQGYELPEWEEFKDLDLKGISSRAAEAKKEPALRHALPEWLETIGQEALGDTWEPTIRALNQEAPVYLRTNTLLMDQLNLQNNLAKNGIETELVLDTGLRLVERKPVFKTDAFKRGWFEMQDGASQLVAPYCDVKPGMRIIDACAGGGGKALHLATLMENKGQLIALDTEDWKLLELKRRARRNKISVIETRVIESSKVIKRLKESADRVLLDVPCSGLGVLRRNPGTKWKLDPEFFERIAKTQADILDRYSQMVKPGGKLVYATCSILPRENEDQVNAFLAKHPEFQLEESQSILPQDTNFDGFYMARMVRNG